MYYYFFYIPADPTRIVVPPEDLHILIGTTAQLSCTAEYDASFSDDFELLWEKDGVEISLNDTEASRWEFNDLQAAQCSLSMSDFFLFFMIH